MPFSHECRLTMPLIATQCLAGFALTVWIFYPGIETYDARYIYADIAKGLFGDWQSPVMTALWALIDPIAPGTASIFLLIAALYWCCFGLLASALRRASKRLAFAAPALGLMPSAFVFAGVVWRDILFAEVWLLAALIVYAGANSRAIVRAGAQSIAVLLIALGVLLRPNAILSAPFLLAYAFWPTSFRFGRLALFYLPAAIACYVLVPLIYYGVFDAQRQNPLHSVFVYDLGGITHFTRENQFPVAWTPEERQRVIDDCYTPEFWDAYWTRSCSFVMARLEGEQKLFGRPELAAAWRHAVRDHPIAYLQHRGAFFWRFLTGSNLGMWTVNIDDPTRPLFEGRGSFAALISVYEFLQPTVLLRTGFWLLLDLALCAVAWPLRARGEVGFVIGICGSAVAYLATFFLVGVAADFRYGLWAVFAALAGFPVLATLAVQEKSRLQLPS
jgi:hypothetical protein